MGQKKGQAGKISTPQPDRYPLKAALFLALGAAILRLAVVVWRQDNDPLFHQPINDADIYRQWALALAAGTDFGLGGAPYFLPPLYPWFTGLIFKLTNGSLSPVTLVQGLFGVGTILGIHRLGFRLYGHRPGLIAGVIALLFGPALWYEGWLLPTTMNLFLLTMVLNLLVEGRDTLPIPRPRTMVIFAALGVVLGLASINRPQNLLLAVLILAWFWWRGKAAGSLPFRPLGILLAGLIITIAPVTIRNLSASGEAIPISANGGVNFYVGNHDGADGRFSLPPGFPAYIGQMQEVSRQMARTETGQNLNWSQTSSFWFKKGMSALVHDPARTIKLIFLKARLVLSYREMENNFVVSWVREKTGPGRWLIPSLGLLWLLAMPAVIESLRRRNRCDMVLLIPTVTVIVVCLIFWVSTRNRLPLMIPLAVWAGVSLSNLRLWKVPLNIVLTVLVAGAVFWPTADSEGAAFLYDVGRIHAQKGQIEEARENFRESMKIEPDFPMALNGMALTYMDEGKPDRAIAMLREIIRKYPDFELAKQNLQAILNYQKNQQKKKR